MSNTTGFQEGVTDLHFIGYSFIREFEVRSLLGKITNEALESIIHKLQSELGKLVISQLELGLGIIKEIEARINYLHTDRPLPGKIEILLMEECLDRVLIHLGSNELNLLLSEVEKCLLTSQSPEIMSRFSVQIRSKINA